MCDEILQDVDFSQEMKEIGARNSFDNVSVKLNKILEHGKKSVNVNCWDSHLEIVDLVDKQLIEEELFFTSVTELDKKTMKLKDFLRRAQSVAKWGETISLNMEDVNLLKKEKRIVIFRLMMNFSTIVLKFETIQDFEMCEILPSTVKYLMDVRIGWKNFIKDSKGETKFGKVVRKMKNNFFNIETITVTPTGTTEITEQDQMWVDFRAMRSETYSVKAMNCWDRINVLPSKCGKRLILWGNSVNHCDKVNYQIKKGFTMYETKNGLRQCVKCCELPSNPQISQSYENIIKIESILMNPGIKNEKEIPRNIRTVFITQDYVDWKNKNQTVGKPSILYIGERVNLETLMVEKYWTCGLFEGVKYICMSYQNLIKMLTFLKFVEETTTQDQIKLRISEVKCGGGWRKKIEIPVEDYDPELISAEKMRIVKSISGKKIIYDYDKNGSILVSGEMPMKGLMKCVEVEKIPLVIMICGGFINLKVILRGLNRWNHVYSDYENERVTSEELNLIFENFKDKVRKMLMDEMIYNEKRSRGKI